MKEPPKATGIEEEHKAVVGEGYLCNYVIL